jgi:hypothetical protein
MKPLFHLWGLEHTLSPAATDCLLMEWVAMAVVLQKLLPLASCQEQKGGDVYYSPTLLLFQPVTTQESGCVLSQRFNLFLLGFAYHTLFLSHKKIKLSLICAASLKSSVWYTRKPVSRDTISSSSVARDTISFSSTVLASCVLTIALSVLVSDAALVMKG